MSGDPFHVVRGEVQVAVDAIEKHFVRLEGLLTASDASHPSREELSIVTDKIRESVRTVEWDLQDLSETITAVENNRRRFSISNEEIQDRRDFVTQMQAKMIHVRDRLSVMERQSSLAARGRVDKNAVLNPTSHIQRHDDRFMDNELQLHERIMTQQDEGLDQLTDTVIRIGNLGRSIQEELLDQNSLLNNVDTDMDRTHDRFAQLQSKLNAIIEETGRRQFCMVFGLLLAFIVLTALVVAM
mmetsp:Transcript_17701/g.36738  ORF Transcript_17701/g.36738 Transcript_17701/m.36738 type:complete len:242 (+) Transcript_17701:1780-2505(+)